MDRSVLDWLERTERQYGDRMAYAAPEGAMCFSEIRDAAERIGSGLLRLSGEKGPVAILMSRKPETVAAIFGTLYSGRAYAPLDPAFPESRILKILETLKPAVIISDEKHTDRIRAILKDGGITGKLTSAEALLTSERDQETLSRVRERVTESDPMYILFTSGSTGTPKGVVTSHRALMSYISAYAEMMDIREEDRLGCQAPLDYIAAIRDLYLPALCGAYTYLIPHSLFMQPERLAETLRRERITALGWSTSALSLLAGLGFLKRELPETLRKICFSGSVMPASVLRAWQERLPGTRFVNQYGPTEATASCTWYEMDHLAEPGEEVPIGKPYRNYRILLLREDGSEAEPGERGEICVAGPCLALGYYGDPERTARDFIQNPLHRMYDERIYRTGDIGSLRADGNLMFHGRKDRMIKHMGHRIELEEVECAAMALEGIRECAALYQAEKETLWLVYAGEMDSRELARSLRKSLPGFMVPRKMLRMDALPRLESGKTDLPGLRAMLQEEPGRET